MKRIRIDNKKETLVLTGLIVDDNFIRTIKPMLNYRSFSKHSKKIAKWCIDYFDEMGKAPGVHIQDIFDQKVEDGVLQEDEERIIARILERVSKEFNRAKQFNFPFVKKIAEAFFCSKDLKKFLEELEEVAEKNPREAVKLIQGYNPVLLQESQGISVLKDTEVIRTAFEETYTPLFKMPGALGQMINDDLYRGAFIGLMGQEKIGKTWNLMEFAIQASRRALNVAMFQCGDMTVHQQAVRISVRLAGRSNRKKYCGKILVPTYDCEHNQLDTCGLKRRTCKYGLEVKDIEELEEKLENEKDKRKFFFKSKAEGYVPCQACRKGKWKRNYKGALWYKEKTIEPLTWREAVKINKKFYKRMRGRDFKIIDYPSDTLTIPMIESQLNAWIEQEGFVPDVLIFDYADLFATHGTGEFRQQQNSIWKGLRGISQKYNVLVITATQADAQAYGKASLGLKNFSEDKRKYAHVTAFYALNQTPEEKVMGRMRVAQLVIRESDFDIRKQVKVLQSFKIGRAHIGSYF